MDIYCDAELLSSLSYIRAYATTEYCQQLIDKLTVKVFDRPSRSRQCFLKLHLKARVDPR